MILRYSYELRDKTIHAEYSRPNVETSAEAEQFVLETLRGFLLVTPNINLEIIL